MKGLRPACGGSHAGSLSGAIGLLAPDGSRDVLRARCALNQAADKDRAIAGAYHAPKLCKPRGSIGGGGDSRPVDHGGPVVIEAIPPHRGLGSRYDVSPAALMFSSVAGVILKMWGTTPSLNSMNIKCSSSGIGTRSTCSGGH